MQLKELKEVKLFKFINEKSHRQVNIYVEPTAENQGRLIVIASQKAFQRYFDGAGKDGIYGFLLSNSPESISCCFDNIYDVSDEDQLMLKERLTEVWPIFILQVKEIIDKP